MSSVLAKAAPLLFVAMWSSGAIFVKLGLQDASVLSFLLVRALGAFAVIVLIAQVLVSERVRALFNLSIGEWIRVASVGLVLQVAYQVFFFAAIASGLSPGMLAIVLGMQPLLTPIMARQSVGRSRFIILLAGFAGLVLAILGGHEVGVSTPLGLAFGGCAVVSITVGTLLQKGVRTGVVTSVIGQYAVSSLVYLVAVFLAGFHVEATPQFAVSALWMVFVVSAGAILLLVFMLDRSEVSDVSALFYLVPVITYALDYAVFGNPVSFLTVAGGLIVVCCVFAFRRTNSPGHVSPEAKFSQ